MSLDGMYTLKMFDENGIEIKHLLISEVTVLENIGGEPYLKAGKKHVNPHHIKGVYKKNAKDLNLI